MVLRTSEDEGTKGNLAVEARLLRNLKMALYSYSYTGIKLHLRAAERGMW
jgi:hypothetical protein